MKQGRLRTFAPVVVIALSLTLLGCATIKPLPAHWATPLEDSRLPNGFQVEPDLFRSAQPDADGFAEIERRGVKTVLNLRHDFDDAAAAPGASFTAVQVSMRAFEFYEEDVLRALRVLVAPANRPVLVHCKRGADRTGGIIAMYRVIVQGWSKDEALREMLKGGYGYYPFWRDIIERIREADVAHYRRELGLPPLTAEAPETAASP